MSNASGYHEGERLAQTRAGDRALAERLAGMVRGDIEPRAQDFLAAQPLLIAALADEAGAPWASVLAGEAGMATTADGREVDLDLSRIAHLDADPFWRLAQTGADIGLLAIDLSHRRRLRINGRITARAESLLVVAVRESYPNCPKYISPRQVAVFQAPADPSTLGGDALGPAQLALVARTDTVFVATRHAERGADASHRGGPPGFVQALDARTLRVPDYVGNSMYNTLGNLLVDPRAGLLFLDFTGQRMLQVTGRATVDFDAPVPAGAPRGAGTPRAWNLAVERWIEAPLPLRVA